MISLTFRDANSSRRQSNPLAAGETEYRIITEGSYLEYVQYNLTEHAADPLFGLFLFAFESIPLMLIGMALYRWGFFSGGLDSRKMMRWGIAGIVLGSVATLLVALWVKGTGFSYWSTLAAFMSVSLLPRLPVVLGSRRAGRDRAGRFGLACRAHFRCRSRRLHQLSRDVDRDARAVSWLGCRALRCARQDRTVPRHFSSLGPHAGMVEAMARTLPLRPARMALALPHIPTGVPSPTMRTMVRRLLVERLPRPSQVFECTSASVTRSAKANSARPSACRRRYRSLLRGACTAVLRQLLNEADGILGDERERGAAAAA